ncbi:MAG: class A beta-lactamase-related serine hydrolase, partial [Chloroflexi bacterium]|nr:class A beta-lactamase-related serine hydrolase [Chloroflexota bacterium]
TLNLRNLAVLMMSISDNSATNALVERLGIENINGAMRAAGMTNSHLHRKIKMKLPDKPKHPFFATGTPRDYMGLMCNLYEGRLLNKRNTKAVLDLMRVQSYMGTLWRYLDFNPDGDKDEWVASKNGYSSGVRSEAGIVHTNRGAYAICVMGKDIKDKAWTQDNEGTLAIARVSKAVRDHFL